MDATHVELRIDELTNEQIIAWYSKHPSPTVRSLVERLKISQQEQLRAYEEGFFAGVQSKSPDLEAETRGFY